jgi:hypothetical protein
MPFSNAVENDILDHWTGKATWTAPTAVYVGLSSTTPTKTGTNVTEPSGGAYARIQVTSAQFDSAASGATQTNTDKSFAAATADWVSGSNLTYMVFYDAVTSGNFIGFAQLGTARPVLNGDTATINSGELDLAFS